MANGGAVLSYQQLLQSYPKPLMSPDTIFYLHNGVMQAKGRRGSALLEMHNFLSECRQPQTLLTFFSQKPLSQIEILGQKYVDILQEKGDVEFSEEDIIKIKSHECQALYDLIEKHHLIVFSNNDVSSTFTRTWR